jgi:hypothetical protein
MYANPVLLRAVRAALSLSLCVCVYFFFFAPVFTVLELRSLTPVPSPVAFTRRRCCLPGAGVWGGEQRCIGTQPVLWWRRQRRVSRSKWAVLLLTALSEVIAGLGSARCRWSLPQHVRLLAALLILTDIGGDGHTPPGQAVSGVPPEHQAAGAHVRGGKLPDDSFTYLVEWMRRLIPTILLKPQGKRIRNMWAVQSCAVIPSIAAFIFAELR